MPRNIHVVGVVVRLVGVDVVVAVARAHVLEAEPGVLPVSADEGVVGCLRGARAGGVRLRVVPVGSALMRHGGRVVIVGGLVLVEGEGFFEVSDANVEGGVHVVNRRPDREVVVSDGADQEGAVERGLAGVVGLVAQGARGRGRDDVVPVLPLVAVGIDVVVPRDASGDVGPVVATLGDVGLQPALGHARLVSVRVLVAVPGVVDAHAAHDAEECVVGDGGRAVGRRVVENGGTDASLGAIEDDLV